jgi:hypothetical protein
MTDQRNHRVKSDYGSNDYYRSFSKNSEFKHIDRSLYGNVLREFNDYVRDGISLKGAEYILPFRLGKIQLRKKKTEVKIGENGEIINNLPPNWKATRELWGINEDAKKKKIKIRFTNDHTDGYTFRIVYLRSKANYKNKSIYKIRMNRMMKRNLSKSIFLGKIDAFLK